MPPQNLDEQLHSYLTDAHSIEQQALAQMKVAPRMAGDPDIADAFKAHLSETEEQERLVRERLEAHGHSPSRVKDAVMAAGGLGFALFARLQPDTPGKLVAHSYSYEHLEVASYGTLSLVAERADDSETVAVAGQILGQEREMAKRLEGLFDRAVEASLPDGESRDPGDDLIAYLRDAHAIVAQVLEFLPRAEEGAREPELRQVFEVARTVTERHRRLVEERLEAHGAGASTLKDAAMRLGGLNWSAFFAAHPDTPGKLTAFAYALKHLQIAGFELLGRVAERANDAETAKVTAEVLAEDRVTAERLAGSFGVAVEASLREQDVGV